MVKGSKAMRCYKCNRIVAWHIPTGKTCFEFGEIFKEKKLVDYKITFKGYACVDCNEIKGV